MTSNHWYFTKEELQHGQSPEDLKLESSQRRSTCTFLQEAGMKLRLPQLTIATALTFFHRVYTVHRLKDLDRYIIATTCLFLAGKVEETPKKLKDVIDVSYMVRNKKELAPDSEEFLEYREQILVHELLTLQTIGFDLNVEHPYKYLLNYVKSIQGNKNLAQVAWNFVNDSLRTTLCLQFRPQLIASAAIYLASKFLKHPLPEGKRPWWEIFDAKMEELEEISSQILDLYESSPYVMAIKSPSVEPTTPTNTTQYSPSNTTPTASESNENENGRSTNSNGETVEQEENPNPSVPVNTHTPRSGGKFTGEKGDKRYHPYK